MKNQQPPVKLQRAAASVNVLATSLGMVSLGLLAMLITHHSLESKGLPAASIGVVDALTFLTNILGKIAIVLFFNGPIFSQLFNQLYQEGIRSFFTVPKRTFWQHLGQTFNYILSLNASLFWAGLVQVTFLKSATLLDNFNTRAAHTAASYIRQWYFYLVFVSCSFYANWLAWPGIHQAGYDQKISALQWLLERPDYRWLKTSVAFQLEQAHQKILGELKAVINAKNEARSEVPTPQIDALAEELSALQENTAQPAKPIAEFSEKLNCIIQTKRSPELWRETCLKAIPQNSPTISVGEWAARHAFAILFVGIGIWGFHNVMGLSDVIWSNWDAPMISTYFARYAVFYSMAEVTMLTVYPMIYGLVGVLKHGIPTHVFSNFTLGLILSIVILVGICSGLANAEQSDLDNESIVDIGIAGVAAFLEDSFGIYMVSRRFFESRIADQQRPHEDSEDSDKTTTLQQQYLKLNEKAQKMTNIQNVHGAAVHKLAGITGLDKQASKRGSVLSIQDTSEPELGENEPLTGRKFRIFSFGESVFRAWFSISEGESRSNNNSLQ